MNRRYNHVTWIVKIQVGTHRAWICTSITWLQFWRQRLIIFSFVQSTCKYPYITTLYMHLWRKLEQEFRIIRNTGTFVLVVKFLKSHWQNILEKNCNNNNEINHYRKMKLRTSTIWWLPKHNATLLILCPV